MPFFYVLIICVMWCRKEGEEIRMKKVNAAAVPDRMLYCISHDMKTPLSAMMGYAVLLEQQCCDAERVKTYAAKIQSSGVMLTSMINDVLDFAGAGSVAAEERIDPDVLAEEALAAVEPQMRQKKQSFELQIKENETSFIGDRGRLLRVITNLLSNSVKYTPEKGSIRLSLSATGFVLEDDGPGMSEDFQKVMFEPFAREMSVCEPGTGLGLYIVKGIIDDMGGRIEIKSRPGEGTAVTVDFCREDV